MTQETTANHRQTQASVPDAPCAAAGSVPLISVIVPVYNDEATLAETLDSIIAQSYRNIEVIITDDGSTDRSGEMAERYAARDGRIRVIHQSNQGVSAARNAAVAAARGEYVMMVDADDVVHPQIVETLLQPIFDSKECKASICSLTFKGVDAMTTKGKTEMLTPKETILRTLYQQGLYSSISMRLIPADVAKNTPHSMGRYEDLDLVYRIYEKIDGLVAYTSAPMYYYRINGDNFVSNFSPTRLDVLAVTDRMELHYVGQPEFLRAARDRKFSANYNMYVLSHRAGMKDVAARCWQVIKDYRREEITNPRVRFKNKLGALLSYLGRTAVNLVSHLVY